MPLRHEDFPETHILEKFSDLGRDGGSIVSHRHRTGFGQRTNRLIHELCLFRTHDNETLGVRVMKNGFRWLIKSSPSVPIASLSFPCVANPQGLSLDHFPKVLLTPGF
jgi:hypothetical protein